MKRFVFFMVVALMSSASFSQSVKQQVKTQIEDNNIYVRLSSAKVSKDAKKRAKADKKDGWKVVAGEKSLERQYTEMEIYSNTLMTSIYGNQIPRYMSHTGLATGKTYDMAFMDARLQCNREIAGQLETQVVASLSKFAEGQKLSDKDNASVEKLNSKMSSLVNTSLSFIPLGTTYRLKDDMYQVSVRLACDKKEFFDKLKVQMLKESEFSDETLEKLLDDALGGTGAL